MEKPPPSTTQQTMLLKQSSMRFSLNRTLFLIAVSIAILALPSFLVGKEGLLVLQNISLSIVIAVFFLSLTRWFLLSWRWQLLLEANQHQWKKKNLLPIVLAIDFFGDNGPASLGSFASSLLLFKQRGIPTSTTTAINNLLFLLDLAAVGTVILAALLFATNMNIGLSWLAAASMALLLFSVLALIVLIHHIDKATQLILRLPLPNKLLLKQRKKAFFWWYRLQRSLKITTAIRPNKIAALYLISLSSWGIRFSMLFIALIALGAEINWPVTALIQFISGLAGMISFLPGGFPSMDISITVLLSSHLEQNIILPALLLWRLATYHVNFIAGSLSILWLARK